MAYGHLYPDNPKMDSSIVVYGRRLNYWPKSNSTVLARDVKIGKSYVSNWHQTRNVPEFVTEIIPYRNQSRLKIDLIDIKGE